MGKSALKISKVLLAASSSEFLRVGKYSREAAESKNRGVVRGRLQSSCSAPVRRLVL